MFNLSGSEMVFLLLIALVVLGPEKLPEAVRRFGKAYGEFKKMTTGFQSELRSALDEPMREMRDTADAMRKAATFDFDLSDTPTPVTSGSTSATQTHSTPADEVATAVDTVSIDGVSTDAVATDDRPATSSPAGTAPSAVAPPTGWAPVQPTPPAAPAGWNLVDDGAATNGAAASSNDEVASG